MGIGTLLSTCSANSNSSKDIIVITNNEAEVGNPEYTGYSCIHSIDSRYASFGRKYQNIKPITFNFADPQIIYLHDNMIFSWEADCVHLIVGDVYYVKEMSESEDHELIYYVD